MGTFQIASATLKNLDPHKRINYTLGLVLGQDEFQQEQTYFVEAARRHDRTLHGYGTSLGLQVTAADTVAGPELRVSPGMAVNPQGTEICISSVMCARLNAWLAANRAALTAFSFAAPNNLDLCVVLCARECLTDTIPVPSEPCRTQNDVMQPSRILDSFELKLAINQDPPAGPPTGLYFRPASVEEQGINRLGVVLSRLKIDDVAASLTPNDMITAVRTIGKPGDPDPPSAPVLTVRTADRADRLRTAMRIWITEIRPNWNEKGAAMGCDLPSEKCVLLANVRLAVSAVFDVAGGAAGVGIDDTTRPLLVSTRVLDELDRRRP